MQRYVGVEQVLVMILTLLQHLVFGVLLLCLLLRVVITRIIRLFQSALFDIFISPLLEICLLWISGMLTMC